MIKSTSLLQRLIIAISISLTIGSAIAAGFLYWKLIEELDELFDARLRVIASNLNPDLLTQGEVHPPIEAEDNIVIQRWSQNGRLIYSSDARRIPAPIPTLAGNSERRRGSELWNMYAVATVDGGWLEVAQEYSARKKMAFTSVARIFWPFASILAITGILVAFLAARQLRPLRALAQQLRIHGISKSTVDFELLLKTVLAELYPLAMQKNIYIGLIKSSSCAIRGEAEGLRSLVANLLDNAIRYTPSEGRVLVSLVISSGNAELLISDTGKGIPRERRKAVFERFVRDGSADSRGTGLGLAIVRQVLERHGGSIALDDGANGVGLTVRVWLPLAHQ